MPCSTGGPGPQAGPGEPVSGFRSPAGTTFPKTGTSSQSLPRGLAALGSGWTVPGHAARRRPGHFISRGRPSPRSLHVLCPGLRAGRAPKPGAEDTTGWPTDDAHTRAGRPRWSITRPWEGSAPWRRLRQGGAQKTSRGVAPLCEGPRVARFRDREEDGGGGPGAADRVSLWDACPAMGRYVMLQTVQCKTDKKVNFTL